jgi:hypothetical protein
MQIVVLLWHERLTTDEKLYLEQNKEKFKDAFALFKSTAAWIDKNLVKNNKRSILANLSQAVTLVDDDAPVRNLMATLDAVRSRVVKVSNINSS